MSSRASKDDPYAMALRDLRRGLGDGKARAGKDADAEWLAARWPPYLAKRAEKATPSTICAEITTILGHGSPPAWFRREEVTAQEREVLEKELAKQRKARDQEREDRGAEALEEQVGSTHVLVEDLHNKAFARQESIKNRTKREFREKIANMDHASLLEFWEQCQDEFGVSRKKHIIENIPSDIPSVDELEKKWREEDQKSLDGTTAVPESDDDLASCSEKPEETESILKILLAEPAKTPPAQVPEAPAYVREARTVQVPKASPAPLPTPDGHDCAQYGFGRPSDPMLAGRCDRCCDIHMLGYYLGLITEGTEAQFLLCSPQYILENFRKQYGADMVEKMRSDSPYARPKTCFVMSASRKFFFEYTAPALQAEQDKQAVRMVLLNAYHKAQDSSEDKPMTWTEFQKANKGKTRKQVSEEWQAFKKQRKE